MSTITHKPLDSDAASDVKSGKTTVNCRFRIIFDAPVSSGKAAALGEAYLRATVAAPGSELTENSGLFAYSYQIRMESADRRLYVGTVTYTTLDSPGSNDAPWDKPGVWDRQPQKRTYMPSGAEDLDGRTFKNFAGDPLDPIPELFTVDSNFSYKKAVKDIADIQDWIAMDNSCNTDEIVLQFTPALACAAYFAGCQIAGPLYYYGEEYYDVTWNFVHTKIPGGWEYFRAIMVGFNVLKTANDMSSRTRARDPQSDAGTPTPTPVFLAVNGTRSSEPIRSNWRVVEQHSWPELP